MKGIRNLLKRTGCFTLALLMSISLLEGIDINKAYAAETDWNYTYEDIGNSYATWTCPANGIYKFEAWGASGGGCTSANGYYSGGYTWITIKCHVGDKYYIYCGQHGENNASINNKTYGDGGAGLPSNPSTGECGLYYNASGGGATSIRSTAGIITSNYNNQVLVAGGGAGKCNENNIVNDYFNITIGNGASGQGRNSYFYTRADGPGHWFNTGRATGAQGGGFVWSGKQMTDVSYAGETGGTVTNNENYLISSGGQGYINPEYTINYAIVAGGNLGHGKAHISYVEPITSTITFECGAGNTYNGYGDANGNYSITKEYGESIALEEAIRSNWSFTYWTNTSDTSQTKIYAGDTYTFGDDNVIFKPHFIYDGNATFYAVEDLSDTTKKVDHYIHVNNIDDGIAKYVVFQTSLDGGTTWQSVNSDGFSFDESQANKRFDYTGSYQVYNVPATGYYQLFAKGGDGGASYSNQGTSQYGVKGNDISGKVKLNYGEKLYIYVGAAGVNGGSNGQGYISSSFGWGYGGGGYNQGKTPSYGGWIGGGGAGGGATTFALSTSNVSSRLLVAGGGAGAGTWSSQYNDNPCFRWQNCTIWGYGYGSSPNGDYGRWEKFGNGNDRRVSGGGGGGWSGGKQMHNGLSGYMSSRVTNITQSFGSCTSATDRTINSNFASSKQNGYATLKFLDSDVKILSFDADFKVSPYDTKAPDDVIDISLSSDINNEDNIIISWDPSRDNGDTCLYKAEIFDNETKTKLYDCEDLNSTSNPKSKTIGIDTTSGTKGYYYYIDASAANNVDIKTYVDSNIANGGTGTGTGVITGKNVLFKGTGNEQHIMTRNSTSQYIHICSVDYAGNISNTRVFEIPQGVIIKFDKNDTDKNLSGDDCTTTATGTMPQQVVTFGSTTELNENAYAKKGYTFIEWNTQSDGTGGVFADKQEISYQDLVDTYGLNLNLYAQWKPIEYNIYYEKGLTDNGGTTNKTTHNYDSAVTLASTGFTGMSYSINFDANKPSNATGTVENMPSNITGNLQFDKWSVSATNNSGEYSANTNLGAKNFESTNGATAHATALWKKSYYYEKKQPTLKDWEFVGWSTDKNATSGDLIAAEDILPSTSAFNKTLYAIWKPVEYKITYSANGATNVPSTQTKKADTSIKLSSLVPERQFYRFIEWNTNADGSGTAYQPSQTYSTNADLTLYAIFDYNKDDIYYYKGLTNDITHTDIIKATRNSNIQSNNLLAQPYTQWVMNNNILIAGIGTVKGREYKVSFDYNIPVSATNEQKDTVIISGYTNDASGKTTYKVNDYLKFNKWSLTGSKLLPPTIEPEQTYKPVYRKHVHSGSSSTGGGCYTIRRQRTDSYTTTCGCASCWCEGFNGISDNWNCVHCGHGHMGPHGDGIGTGNGRCTATKRVYYTVVYYELGCGKTEGVRYQDEGIDYYAIDANPNYTGPFGTEATNKIATALWKNVTFGNFKTPTMDGWKFMGWYDNQAGNNSTAVSTVLKTKDTDYYTNKINTTTDKSANSNVKVYGDLTEYTVEPSTGIFDRTLYARWQRTITLTFNLNGGQYLGKSEPIVMTGIYYNNSDGYNFSINDTLTQKHLPDYETQISNYKLNGTQKGIDAYGTYDTNGENNKYTLIKDDGTRYRFLGWSTNPSATEPDSNFSVYNNNHKIDYRIYKDTTLYAVWEPVLTANMQVYRTLGNMKFSDGSSPKTDISGIRASDGLQQLQVIAKPGEQCGYNIALTGSNDAKVGIQFDTKITDIYNHQGTWTDNLNPSTEEDLVSNQNHGLDRNIQLSNKTATRKFYIPQYLGTDKSYITSQGIKVYTADMLLQQDSYYYKGLGTKEEISVHITIYLTTDKSGGSTPPTPGVDPDPIISVLDELRTKLKIRLK